MCVTPFRYELIELSNLVLQGDLFSGLNDGLISRAEALAAVDIKHQSTGGPAGLPQLKHDMMYHSMGAPPPVSRPQVSRCLREV